MSRYPGLTKSTSYASPPFSPSNGQILKPNDVARASYPTFISFPETLKLQITYAFRGFLDSFRWDFVITTIAADSEIRANVYKSLLLNTLSLTSIYVFDLLLLPLVRNQQKWLHRNVGWFYQVLWLFPVVGVSLYLNSSWCNVVAKRTYALHYGNRQAATPATYTGMLTALATSAYRGVMVFTSMIISLSLSYIPLFGLPLGFAFFAWVDAYYCFEFIWIARGLSLSQRIRYLEERWAYYFAFGLLTIVSHFEWFPDSEQGFTPAAMCMWGNGLANAAIFALVLPFYIIMAMRARPVPKHPFNPLSESSADGLIQYPSPFIPIRIPVFAPVIWLNDIIVRILNMGVGRPKADGRRRGLSESLAESVEEGGVNEAIELRKVKRGPKNYTYPSEKLANGFLRRKNN